MQLSRPGGDARRGPLGVRGNRRASINEWIGVALLLFGAFVLTGKRLDAARWVGATGVAVVLFTRAVDQIDEQLAERATRWLPVWRGCEFTAAGIALPAAGMSIWAGWALVAVGLTVQVTAILHPRWPPARRVPDGGAGGVEQTGGSLG
ncbi:MAG: hypothetical protein ACRD0Y_07515 [Terriglobales bacterium]